MKSLAMLNLNRMSPDTSRTLALKLDLINKNILYITHMEDKILKLLKTITTDKDLQTQVDRYFEEDIEDNAETKAEQVPEN